MSLLAADDGIWQGNANLADVFFLVAFILAVIVTIVRLMVRPVPIDSVLMAAAVAALSLAWLVL